MWLNCAAVNNLPRYAPAGIPASSDRIAKQLNYKPVPTRHTHLYQDRKLNQTHSQKKDIVEINACLSSLRRLGYETDTGANIPAALCNSSYIIRPAFLRGTSVFSEDFHHPQPEL